MMRVAFAALVVPRLLAQRSATTRFREALQCYSSPSCDPLGGGGGSVCVKGLTHIAMTLDAEYLPSSIAGILSIVRHSACPENVAFHFIAAGNESGEAELRRAITSTFPYKQFRVYHFDAAVVALDRPLNYAMIYLAELLPAWVSPVVHLDSDLVLVDDIAKLWVMPLGESAVNSRPSTATPSSPTTSPQPSGRAGLAHKTFLSSATELKTLGSSSMQ